MSDAQLLPCPFCGGDAVIERKGDRRMSTVVSCLHCGCRLENGETFDHGAAWNTRADSHAALTAERDALLEALDRIANAPAWGAPDKWETTPADLRQFARAALKGQTDDPV